MICGITMAAPAAYNLPGTVELNLKADRASAENLLSDWFCTEYIVYFGTHN